MCLSAHAQWQELVVKLPRSGASALNICPEKVVTRTHSDRVAFKSENRFKDSNRSYRRIKAQDKTGYIASPNNKRNTSFSADEYNLATRKESKKFDHGAEPE